MRQLRCSCVYSLLDEWNCHTHIFLKGVNDSDGTHTGILGFERNPLTSQITQIVPCHPELPPQNLGRSHDFSTSTGREMPSRVRGMRRGRGRGRGGYTRHRISEEGIEVLSINSFTKASFGIKFQNGHCSRPHIIDSHSQHKLWSDLSSSTGSNFLETRSVAWKTSSELHFVCRLSRICFANHIALPSRMSHVEHSSHDRASACNHYHWSSRPLWVSIHVRGEGKVDGRGR